MNKVYALVWNQTQGCWNVAHEGARRRCKPGGRRLLLLGLAWAGSAVISPAFALPTGGVVASGKGDVLAFGNGTQMAVNQHTDKMIVNWNDFSVGAGQKVLFNQPTSSSVALNRVVGTNVSSIQGQIDANGRIFLVNPNGMVVGQGAQINVGSLVATTKNISDADFLAGKYTFNGQSNAEIINNGTISAAQGGNIALLGNQVRNTGVIQAKMGRVALGAGNDFTLSFDGNQLLDLQVNAEAINALAQNGGLLKADGGQVLMTARGAGSMLQAVVNNQGAIEAKTLNANAGRITLDGGNTGNVLVGGALTASALDNYGNGGVIETKGANVEAQLGTQVDTRASSGRTGTWTISSHKVAIQPDAAAASGTVYADTLSRNLGNSNIVVASTADDLTLSGQVQWSSGNSLTLSAAKDVRLDGVLTATGGGAELALKAGGDLNINNKVSLTGINSKVSADYTGASLLSGTGKMTLSGAGSAFQSNGVHYKVVQTLNDLQSVNNNLGGFYVLGNDINGRSAQFKSIGGNATFNGVFDGLGNTLSSLQITNTGNNLGLFSSSAGTITNLKLETSTVNGYSPSTNGFSAIGGLVGLNTGVLSNVATRNVSVLASNRGANNIGGLVGQNVGGTISKAVADGRVTGNANTVAAGGIAGSSHTGESRQASITQSVSKVEVTSNAPRNADGGTGGLVGVSYGSYIADSSSSGSTTSNVAGANVGGLIGLNQSGTLERVSSSGAVRGTGAGHLGGLVGLNKNGAISQSSSSSKVDGNGALSAGGLVGANQNGVLQEVHASGAVKDSYGVNVGGLVGNNSFGIINTGEALGTVTGGQNARVGGLVGNNDQGSIAHSVARGKVTAGNNSHAGGLAGFNGGTLQSVDATGDVSGGSNSYVGGLVGTNGSYVGGSIESAKSSGSVSGAYSTTAGGLVGQNNGQVTNSSTTSKVSGGQSATLGGLVGTNVGTVRQSVASGKLTLLAPGYKQVYGGLVGVNLGEMAYNGVFGEAALVPLAGINQGSIR
ncbi:TPA: filamentous hemagglutinin N-terminal domain-containing protein [Pseudomonas putida]|nr:filamentous hemagglutinin N-terminal domain-containing protein [Pseudomonas putida]